MGGQSKKRSVPLPCYSRGAIASRRVQAHSPSPTASRRLSSGADPCVYQRGKVQHHTAIMDCCLQRVGLAPPFNAAPVTCHQGIMEDPYASVLSFNCPLQKLCAAVMYGHRPQKAARDMLGTCGTTRGECGDGTRWNWVKQ